MFKRVRWVGIGALLGAGGSVYAQVKLRRSAQRYLPPEVGARVADRARRLGQDVADAVAEGRQAMAEREVELRARIEPDHQGGRLGVRDAGSRSLPPAVRPALPEPARHGPGSTAGRKRRDPRGHQR